MSASTASYRPTFDGLVQSRKDWPPGDGYEPGERPFSDAADEQPNDSKSSYSSRTRPKRGMDNDRYDPPQYSERGYVARDGYARDARSDAYEQSQYGANSRGYPVATRTSYGGGDRYDRRRSYDDQDLDDYYEKTRVTKYVRDSGERGLAPYDDGEKRRARSQDYRHQERQREEPPRSRGRRGSESGSDDEREGGENTPMKKWAATFAGAAVGGIAANRIQKNNENNWVPTAIGAVVGGLIGRQVEKKVYEHKDRRREREHEHEHEDRY